MPQYNDCTYDQLVEDYTEIMLDRMTPNDLYEFARESVMDRLENMSERELIDHINGVEDQDTADDIISTHYGINPPDCYITGWQLTKWHNSPTRGSFFVYNNSIQHNDSTWPLSSKNSTQKT